MSLTQTLAGIGVIAGGLVALTGVVIPKVPPIEVHVLEYEAGMVHQDRTVTTDAEFFHASWVAQIQDSGGRVICTGEGSWPYSAGTRIVDIPLDEWVGDEGCLDRLTAGPYTPIASWFWGSDQTTHVGDPFMP